MTLELRDKNVLVVGLGRTGEAVADFLLRRGARVTVSEKKPAESLGPVPAEFAARGARIEAGGHRRETFLAADLIVPSPGVPLLPEYAAARAAGIPILSEIELAYRFLRGRIVGITGTNGKSTTTTLIHRILKAAGRKAVLAGNIGTPLISFVDRSRDDSVYVTEISSFQLEFIERFKADVALFLNASQNHIDWHGSFDAYFASKAKLVLGQAAGGRAVLNRDDARVWGLAGRSAAEVYGFSRRRRLARGAFVRDGRVVVRDADGERPVVRVGEILLPGLHNLENVLAAAMAGALCGAAPAEMRAAIRTFAGLEHRLEPVLTHRGVRFVNDSKATTVDAALKAIGSFDRPIVLILGGKDKGSDFAPLRPVVKARVRRVVLVGAAKDKIRAALAGAVPMDEAKEFREVVPLAAAAAKRGDVVLLAPACTSWDMFADFEERGRVFKRAVRALARRAEGTK